MILTPGQTYFYIVCQTVVFVYLINRVHAILKMRVESKCPCQSVTHLKQVISELIVRVNRLERRESRAKEREGRNA